MTEPVVRRLDIASVPLSRRELLISGGLLLAFGRSRPARSEVIPNRSKRDLISGPTISFDGLIRIASDGVVTFVVPNIEMGQGIYTTEAMMIAEELEISLNDVKVVTALPQDVDSTSSDILRTLSTGGSRSVRKNWIPLRQAAASARLMLIAAAAERWKVDPENLIAEEGLIRNRTNTLHASYGDLAQDASRQPVPRNIPLKPANRWTLIGHPVPRIDIPAKVNGQAVFGIDVQLEGMLVAAVIGPPRWGATVVAVDSQTAKTIPGVIDVVQSTTHVAVIATRYWTARKGLAALNIHWNENNVPDVSFSKIREMIENAAQTVPEIIAHDDPGTDEALKRGRRVQSTYDLPFLAHVPMEPLNATVHVRSDGCDVWVGTQVPTRAQQVVARITGLPEEKIAIHNHIIGGSFGRRLSTDFLEQATMLASGINRPVKFIWSREEDFRQDLYRPAYHDRIEAALGNDGLPLAWRHQITGQSVVDRFAPGGLPKGSLDADAVAGAVDIPYTIPHRRVGWVRARTPVPVGWWRGVGPAHNAYVVESFIDELAVTANIDPIDYRLKLLAHNPRPVAVLQLAASESHWTMPLPRYCGRGIALHNAFGTHCAVITEVSAAPGEAISVRRVTAVIDCGVAVNRDGLKAQIEGGILFGFSAALYGRLSFANSMLEQNNFNNFNAMRINGTPEINTLIIDSHEDTGGIGEVGTAAAFPSLGNALFSATGQRQRSYPFSPHPEA